MSRKEYSYEAERSYYSKAWPTRPVPYGHLEQYLRAWMDPETVFGGKRVLDIGAGECAYTRLIADRFKPTAVVALELFRQRMLPAARANTNPVIRFMAGDALRLPFRDGSFDVVFGGLVLCQIRPARSVAREVARVLVPRGLYVGIEPDPLSPVHLARFFFGAHSPNQFLLCERDLEAFSTEGFSLSVRYFCGRLPWLRLRPLTTVMAIFAERR